MNQHIKDLIDYVRHTPCNTNSAVLQSKLLSYTNELRNFYLNPPTKIEDYFYSKTFTRWSYEKCNRRYLPLRGGCSAARVGQYFGRNFDWYYDESAEFIVTCDGSEMGVHTSLGVVNSFGLYTDEDVQRYEYDENYELLPFLMLDGINDAGVYCNVNVVSTGDHGYTTGTAVGKPNLPAPAVLRFIMDYADSAAEAVELLSEVNIYVPYKALASEFHWMIGDSVDTYIVEIINNVLTVIPADLQSAAPIMTNFYVYNFDGNLATRTFDSTNYNPSTTTLTPHAMGVERYALIQEAIEELGVDSLDDMLAVMAVVEYTQTYDDTTSPFWYSELNGETTTYGDLTIDSAESAYTSMKEAMIEHFTNRVRNSSWDVPGGGTWQTVHRCAYDVVNKCMKVVVQEGSAAHSFTLNAN